MFLGAFFESLNPACFEEKQETKERKDGKRKLFLSLADCVRLGFVPLEVVNTSHRLEMDIFHLVPSFQEAIIQEKGFFPSLDPRGRVHSPFVPNGLRLLCVSTSPCPNIYRMRLPLPAMDPKNALGLILGGFDTFEKHYSLIYCCCRGLAVGPGGGGGWVFLRRGRK